MLVGRDIKVIGDITNNVKNFSPYFQNSERKEIRTKYIYLVFFSGGQGTLEYPCGDRYVGEFEDGKQSGMV
jgi:hypothetical protein